MNAYRDDDDDDGDWEAALADDGEDTEDSDAEPTVPCPSCRREILEDSPWCPYCERYRSTEDHVGQDKPVWVTATALICLGIAIWWVFAAF